MVQMPRKTHSLDVAELGLPHHVVAVADQRNAARLYEIGLGEGTVVTLVKRGDPSILHVGTGTFALARELLRLVSVSCDHEQPPKR